MADSGYVDIHGVNHKVGYGVEGNQVPEDFEEHEIIGSHYNADKNKVLYLIKWNGHPEQSE